MNPAKNSANPAEKIYNQKPRKNRLLEVTTLTIALTIALTTAITPAIVQQVLPEKQNVANAVSKARILALDIFVLFVTVKAIKSAQDARERESTLILIYQITSVLFVTEWEPKFAPTAMAVE